jgi:hypothetical protein
MKKQALVAILVIMAVALVIEFAGPIITAHTPREAHAWISNFGGGLLVAVLVTAVLIHLFIDSERQLLTPMRLTAALIGLLLLVIFRPDANCHVEMHGRRNPIVCD